MQNDSSSRFIMEGADVRGYMLQLNRTLTESLSASDYPAPIRSLLGEFLAAAALLSQTIKFEGRLLLQVKGASPINLIAAEGFAASRDLNPCMILDHWILNTCLPAAHWL